MVKSIAVTGRRKVAFTEAVAPRPKTQAEFERRQRSLSASDALIVVAWLNSVRRTAAYRRVVAVRQEVEDLGLMLNSLHHEKQTARAQRRGNQSQISPQAMKEFDEYAARYRQFRERHNALNRLLSRYAFAPALAPDLDSGIWRFNAVPKSIRGPAIQVSVSDGNLTIQVNETAVIGALARLAAGRELYKVRLCEQCHERWRVSERRMDRFCSPGCREAWYAESPDYGERRRAIQRRYRENFKLKIAAANAARKGRS